MPVKAIEYLQPHGVPLALHSWVPSQPRALLFYIHGTQSHAGWLDETAQILGVRGIAVIAMDRRGSGHSGGSRGDVVDTATLLAEYLFALHLARDRYADLPLTLLGQSLGGSILAALVCSDGFDVDYDCLVLSAPGLGQIHHRLDESERHQVAANSGIDLYEVSLRDEDYTHDAAWLRFIRHDALCIRQITARSRAALLMIEKYYLYRTGALEGKPTALVIPQMDRIINTQIALSVFRTITGGKGAVLELPVREHYLEFSKMRAQYLGWLSAYVLTAGFAQAEPA